LPAAGVSLEVLSICLAEMKDFSFEAGLTT
jgi:hypothetical protein